MKVFVIIPAAGRGTRMAAGKPSAQLAPSKQFTEVGGVPILIHTLRKFAGTPAVNEIFVALRKPEGERFKSRLAKEGFKTLVRIVEGVRGRVNMQLELAIRFHYGSIVPWVRHEGTRLRAIAGVAAVRGERGGGDRSAPPARRRDRRGADGRNDAGDGRL